MAFETAIHRAAEEARNNLLERISARMANLATAAA
jgi:hypothetical protein